ALITRIVEQLHPHLSSMVSTNLQTELETAVAKLQSTSAGVPAATQEKTANPKPRTRNRIAASTTTTVPPDNITPIGSAKVTDEQIKAAYEAIKAESSDGRVTAEALRIRAKISKSRACAWLRNIDAA